MGFSAENIANIKRYGQLEMYIEHERRMISNLEVAEIIEDAAGPDSLSYAHLRGRYGIDVDDSAYPHNAIAWSGDWMGRWPVQSFDGDQERALAYARAALRNHLVAKGRSLLAGAKVNLSMLEAAR